MTTPKVALLALALTLASWSVAGAQMKMPPRFSCHPELVEGSPQW